MLAGNPTSNLERAGRLEGARTPSPRDSVMAQPLFHKPYCGSEVVPMTAVGLDYGKGRKGETVSKPKRTWKAWLSGGPHDGETLELIRQDRKSNYPTNASS